MQLCCEALQWLNAEGRVLDVHVQIVQIQAAGMRCRRREKDRERNKVSRLFKACNYVCIKGEEQRRALQSWGRDESSWLSLIHANKV